MKNQIYKNQAQVEFCELLDRAEERGLKPADVARMLHLSKASISKISKGKQNPRPHTIHALRQLVEELGDTNYDNLVLREETLRYAEKIFKLPEIKRELAKGLINQLSEEKADVNSVPGPQKVEKLAAQSGVAEVVSYRRGKRRSGKSNGNKSTSVPQPPPESNSQLPPPARDPKQHSAQS